MCQPFMQRCDFEESFNDWIQEADVDSGDWILSRALSDMTGLKPHTDHTLGTEEGDLLRDTG